MSELIPFEAITKSKLIGEGAEGLVYSGKFYGEDVALKCSKSKINSKVVDGLNEELKKMKTLRSKYIISYLGVWKDQKNVHYIVTELAELGNLDKYILSHEEIDVQSKYSIAADITSGIMYLHDFAKIRHRDLKSSNILLDRGLVAKISDFGLSKTLSYISNGYGGTLPWSSPAKLNKDISRCVINDDIYSYGMILWELAAWTKPFLNLYEEEIFHKVVRLDQREKIPENTDNTFANIIHTCWYVNPKKDYREQISLGKFLTFFKPKPHNLHDTTNKYDSGIAKNVSLCSLQENMLTATNKKRDLDSQPFDFRQEKFKTELYDIPSQRLESENSNNQNQKFESEPYESLDQKSDFNFYKPQNQNFGQNFYDPSNSNPNQNLNQKLYDHPNSNPTPNFYKPHNQNFGQNFYEQPKYNAKQNFYDPPNQKSYEIKNQQLNSDFRNSLNQKSESDFRNSLNQKSNSDFHKSSTKSSESEHFERRNQKYNSESYESSNIVKTDKIRSLNVESYKIKEAVSEQSKNLKFHIINISSPKTSKDVKQWEKNNIYRINCIRDLVRSNSANFAALLTGIIGYRYYTKTGLFSNKSELRYHNSKLCRCWNCLRINVIIFGIFFSPNALSYVPMPNDHLDYIISNLHAFDEAQELYAKKHNIPQDPPKLRSSSSKSCGQSVDNYIYHARSQVHSSYNNKNLVDMWYDLTKWAMTNSVMFNEIKKFYA